MSAEGRTIQQRNGAAAEALVGEYLARLGWPILARNLRVGRGEIDLVAVEPGEAGRETLVLVEVRSATSGAFGAPEERIDARKVRRAYAAAFALVALGTLPSGERLPDLPWRLDLVVVDARGPGPIAVRHLRGVVPP